MRTSRRTVLRVLAVAGVAAAVLGGLVATGRLPVFNRWVERRLLAELQQAGLQTEETQLRELSWRRAVAGPIELRLAGVTVRAAEARTELGWRVLTGGAAPTVRLRGFEAELDLGRRAEWREALAGKRGGMPAGRIEIEEGRASVRLGEHRLEMPFRGVVENAAGALNATLVADGPAATGRVAFHADLRTGSAEVSVHEAVIAVAPWRPFLDEWVPAAAAVSPAPDARIRFVGTATLADGVLISGGVEADLPALTWREGGWSVDCGPATVQVASGADSTWRLEARAVHAAAAKGAWRMEFQTPAFVADTTTARLDFATAMLRGAAAELQMTGTVGAARSRREDPVTAEASVRLTAGRAAAWSLAAPADVGVRWDGSSLTFSTPALEVAGPGAVQLAALEGSAAGWEQGQPRLVAQAQAAVDAGGWLAAHSRGWQLQPAAIAAKVSVSATLTAGAEAARAEFSVPAQRRTLAGPGLRYESVLGGEATVILDATHLSGRASLAAHEIIARNGTWSVMAPEATLGVRWPRVWLAALQRWSRLTANQAGREILWAGDYDLTLGDAVVRGGSEWCATGVDLKVKSRGAELHETGGIEATARVADLLAAGGLRLKEVEAELGAGLGGGTLRAGSFVPDFGIRPTTEQTLAWAEGFASEGSFGFTPVTLTGAEPFARWWPALAGIEVAGGVGLSGRNRWAGGSWDLAGDLILADLRVGAPARGVSIEGIRGRVGWAGPQPWRTVPAQTVTYQHATLGPLEFFNGSATFAAEAPGLLTLDRWSSAGLGGELECDGFTVDLRRPEFATRLGFKAVKLEELLKLFEDVPAEASASVDGSIPFSWRAGRASVGTGALRLSPGELGRVRFTRDLQLLTAGRNPRSAEYGALRDVERAIRELVFNRLQIDTYPKDVTGQSLRVRLVGAPAGGEYSVPVTLDVNVNAPLDHFLNWGLGGGAPKPAKP